MVDANLPNSPEGPVDGWFKLEQDFIGILDRVESAYNTDQKRVYLYGISYGGFGTWYVGSRHLDRFAALNPVVGYGHADLVQPIAEARKQICVSTGDRDE